jgi:signal transduction histidine kinase
MTAVLGYADLAIDDIHNHPRVAEHLGVIRRNAQHLLTVINDILDLSKLDAGEMRPVLSRVCPAELCAGVADMLRVQADATGIALTVEIHPDTPAAVITDAVRLRQILLNLVGNAIKFTEQGAVRIELAHAGTTATVRVHDTGIGIEPQQLENIFLPFHQADASAARCHGGTGLGLSIARRLAQLLGGELTAQSRPGHGSTFTLTIHAPRAVAARPVPTPAPSHTQPSHTTTPPTLAGRRILLAEDGPDNHKLIS